MTDPTPDTIELWGGAPCLELANSADWDVAGDPVEPERNDVLRTPEMLDSWLRRLGLAGSAPVSADELQRVRDLRAALHRLFSSVAHGAAAEPADLTLLHETFAEAIGVARLERGDPAWRLTWDEGDPRRARLALAVD